MSCLIPAAPASVHQRAWTSCRRTLIAAVVTCLAASQLLAIAGPPADTGPPASAETPAPTQPAAELWFGTMTVPDVRQFRFVVELAGPAEARTGVLTSLDEGRRKFQLAEIDRTKQELRFKLPLTAAEYSGQLDDDGRSARGVWKQRGTEHKLDFRRVEQLPQLPVRVIWKGTLDAVLQKLDVAFIQLESGQLLFDSLSQKAGGFFAKDESTDDEVVFSVPAVRGTFRGRYSDDRQQIVGTWKQGFVELKLVLQRAALADLAPRQAPRPQTPRPPLPYTVREVRFPSRAAGVELAGTLTLPPTAEIVAGVVLISGSGPQDRDETLLGHKPFWVLADHLARQGIACLRYDDRGIGGSGGNFAQATTEDFAQDAEGAWTFLSTMAELKGKPVGLAGHSEGGLIGPLVAAREPRVGFLVLLAGPGVNGEQILYVQSRRLLEAEQATADQIREQERFQRALLKTVVEHHADSQPELAAAIELAMRREFGEALLDKPEMQQKLQAGITQVSSPWFRKFLVLDPREALSKVTCPVLALNGEKDLQVDPDQNLPAIRAALAAAGNQHFETRELPGLNHLFQTSRTGRVSEYEQLEETFSPLALKAISEWIRALNRPPH